MASSSKGLRRVLFVLYMLLLHVAVIYLAADKILPAFGDFRSMPYVGVPDPVAPVNVPTPITDPTVPVSASTATPEPPPPVPVTPPPTGRLLLPVAGVRPEQLVDSFSDARSEGRVHDAIDIAAPEGTPVLAADTGKIVKFFESEKGGITIYQLSSDEKFVYYYAHLQRRADDVQVGDIVQRGRTIGYVGDTGNAGPGNFHLHFSISAITDANRYWEGVSINPYPLLKNGSAR